MYVLTGGSLFTKKIISCYRYKISQSVPEGGFNFKNRGKNLIKLSLYINITIMEKSWSGGVEQNWNCLLLFWRCVAGSWAPWQRTGRNSRWRWGPADHHVAQILSSLCTCSGRQNLAVPNAKQVEKLWIWKKRLGNLIKIYHKLNFNKFSIFQEREKNDVGNQFEMALYNVRKTTMIIWNWTILFFFVHFFSGTSWNFYE